MKSYNRWYRVLFVGLLGIVLWIALTFAQRPGPGEAVPEGLRFRFMGPASGNRISAGTGIPGDLSTYYAGAASGGIWKSTDAGQTWTHMGLLSEGMILDIGYEDGLKSALATPERTVPNGARLGLYMKIRGRNQLIFSDNKWSRFDFFFL